MTILYSNGCSYTANNWVKPEEKYPWLIAQSMSWDLISESIPGSCNSRIIRCAMRDAVELRQQSTARIVALIQLTHLARFEYAGTPNNENQWMYARNDFFQSIKPGDENNWPDEAKVWAKHSTMLYNASAELDQLLCRVVGMTTLFESLDIEYRIFSGPKLSNEVAWPEHNFFDQYLKNKPSVLDLKNFGILEDLTQSKQHPDVSGMKKIAQYFVNQFAEPK